MIGAVFMLCVAASSVEGPVYHEQLTVAGKGFTATCYTDTPFKTGTVAIRTTSPKGTHRIQLTLPSGTWPDDHGSRKFRPILFSRVISSKTILFVTLAEESGVYGYSQIVPYELTASGPKILKSSNDLSFSDYGGWGPTSRGLYMWDYLYLPDVEPHGGPHKYQLFEFELRNGKFKRVGIHTTKKKYYPESVADWVGEASVSKKNDPLREFGLKWRWWGQQ
ncbi:MAG: hypothetical protein KF784_08270 [Fimbriimonadaceae bacterium]|nr:hypothetical protein [Fimbriimonadaceae bacterium]